MDPRTPEELYVLLFQNQHIRLYNDMAAAARRGRLTDADIARVEDKALDFLRVPQTYAHEFPGFDAVAVTERALKDFQDLIAKLRAERTKLFAKEH